MPGAGYSTSEITTQRLDYAGRVDGNPVYMGYAQAGASDTDVNSTDWTIIKFTYDGSNRVTMAQFTYGAAWANRTTETYE